MLVSPALGIGADELVLLYVGRYTNFKGYPTALKAARIFQARDNLKILTCGSPDVLHAYTKPDSSITNLIDIGWTNQVAQYMSIADVLIFPGVREGLPVTVMEALAMHLPVLAYRVRGVEDVIEDEKNGFLVDKLDENQF